MEAEQRPQFPAPTALLTSTAAAARTGKRIGRATPIPRPATRPVIEVLCATEAEEDEDEDGDPPKISILFRFFPCKMGVFILVETELKCVLNLAC
jgi:hypothetical protein